MEIIDLGIDSLDPISLNVDDRPKSPSVSFGPGIELLMNNDKRKGSSTTNFNIDDLNTLESELNDLSKSVSIGGGGGSSGNTDGGSGLGTGFSKSDDFFTSTTKKMSNIGSLFGFGDNNNTADPSKNDSNVGKATAQSANQTTKTFDGFGKINDIPVDFASSSSSRMTEQEKRKKKRIMLKKLEEWYEKGLIKQSSHFTMESNYSEIEDEYEACLEDKKTKDSIKLQQWWFMTFVNSIEYANTVFDPFGLNLDGWGEQVSEDIESYDEIFTELHHKYKGGKLSPELSLLLRLGFSAAVVNITNKALSTSTPGFNDIIKQSPELMKMFTNATVQSLNNQNQNTASSFMSNVLNNSGQPSVNNSFGPPPPAIQTKNQPPPPPPAQMPQKSMQFTTTPSNRPDINASRGAMFREKGIDITNNQESFVHQDRTPISQAPPTTSLPVQRQEMRGPQGDINDLLSGLKPKAPNTAQPSPQIQSVEIPPSYNYTPDFRDDNDGESIISATSLRDLQSSSVPKRSGRRKSRSERNTISLDI
jgi:hypothetical protein